MLTTTSQISGLEENESEKMIEFFTKEFTNSRILKWTQRRARDEAVLMVDSWRRVRL